MGKNKVIISSLLFSLLLTGNNMIAQDKPDKQPGLNPQQKSLVTIAALAASGQLDSLERGLHAGLDAGLTVNEIKETLVQLYAYCGFPRSLNAITRFMKVMDERKAKGIQDPNGKSIILSVDKPGKYERGHKVLSELTKMPQLKPAPGFGEFAPRLDAFLKEHLFADIFDSKVLSYQQRELVTVAALAAMPGTEGQLQSHLKIALNVGVTKEQLLQVTTLTEKNINRTQANILRKLLDTPEIPILSDNIMVRISEIEIVPEFLEEYKQILQTEASASVLKEPGVIAIFPMYQKENPTQVRIVEIYADQQSYKKHLETTHFQHYKSSTLKMVKALKLIDMNGVDIESMPMIFGKIK
ncbi:MAG: carboxymuconolactone decarboxylase family protein [Chitinophagaceae bacterium]